MGGQTLLLKNDNTKNKKIICESAETKAGNFPIELNKAIKEQRAKAKLIWPKPRIYRIWIKNKCLNCNKEWYSRLRFTDRPNTRLMFCLCSECKKELLGLGEEDHDKE
jgi:hypothetical protein